MTNLRLRPKGRRAEPAVRCIIVMLEEACRSLAAAGLPDSLKHTRGICLRGLMSLCRRRENVLYLTGLQFLQQFS
uniref:Uncharacterized protein n=1 Tax=Physcomitrium patens TaxID=3218 RepID=A0A2K1IZV3_PHYPA|nr:hypothetical protein PHYPA_022711 [Physcomitrium patens]